MSRRAACHLAGFLLVAAFGCQVPPQLGLATSGPTQLTPVVSHATATPSSEAEWGTRWCFGAGAPLPGVPALGSEGEIYAATVEGYVHGLRPDGSFQWSYTMKGAALGSPVVQPNGTVVVATTLNLLYALRPTGTRLWVYRVPEPIATPLAVSRHGTLVFGAGKRSLYAVSRYGGLVWRIVLDHDITTPAFLHEDGRVFIGTSKGTEWFTSPTRRTLWESPPVARIVGVTGGEADAAPFWLASGRAFSSNGPMSLGERLQFLQVLADGTSVALERRGIVWRDAKRAPRHRSELEVPPSGSPVVGKQGRLLVPLEDGSIVSVVPGAAAQLHARLGTSPVSDLVVDEARQRVLAAVGEGKICAVSLAPAIDR